MQRISGIFLIAASRGSFLWRHSFFESGKEWKTSRSRWPFERTGQFWQSGKRYLHRGYGIYKPGWQIPCQQKGKRHTGNQKQSRFSGSIYAFKQWCFLQRTVNHSVEQVNRHGADTQHREKVLFPWNKRTQGKQRQKGNRIAACPNQKPLYAGHVHILIRISAVKNKGGQFCTGKGSQSQKQSYKGRQTKSKGFPVPAQGFKPAFLKIVACKEKGVE